MLKKCIKVYFLLIIIIVFCGGLNCLESRLNEEKNSSLLSLERIFSKQEFSAARFGPARWLKDGSGYSTLEPSVSDPKARDLVVHDPQTGGRKILVASQELIPEGESDPIRIENYEWSQDGRKLLIYTNSKRVWRQNTRGDYWVLSPSDKNLFKLGGEAEPSTLMFAKFSPCGNYSAYVMDHNIYVENLKDQKIIQLTEDGSSTIINGTFDWVYEEEFSLRDGFRWSPDGRYIAFWQIDSSGIKDYYLINNTDTLYPEIKSIKYPKVGTTNSACRVGVIPVSGGKTTWFEPSEDLRNNYIARMEWAANSEEIILQSLNRLQNVNRVILGNILDGTMRTIFVDKDETWVEVVNDWKWLDRGNTFTWISERDGWRHVYLISRDGTEVQCITRGDYDVEDLLCIDENGGWIYFISTLESYTQRYLYRVPLTGSDAPERLTPLDQPGTHSYRISDDGKWAFHNYSSFEIPPIIELIRLPSHECLATIIDNSDLCQKVEKLSRNAVEFFRVEIEKGIELDAYCMKPPDFDPSRKYPVLFYVYGEPAGTTVVDRWAGNRYLWHLLLNQKGYVVMSVDNRGTRVPRGRQWRKCIYGQIGILASQDQAKAVQMIVKQRPYIDPDRIGVWGWSGGGSMSLNAIFRYPELYNTAMAIAFVADQRLYDTIYQERYMGLPKDNIKGFQDGSPIHFAHKLKGNLLIIHGTADDNVHYQNFERLVNELIKNNKTFTMMSYPNRSHGIFEGENTTRHLFELLTGYLLNKMPPGPGEK